MVIQKALKEHKVPDEKYNEYLKSGIIEASDMVDEAISKILLAESLEKLGLNLEEIIEYFNLGDKKLFKLQETLLYSKRKAILNSIHGCENTLSKLDYLINELRQKQK